MDDAAGEAMGRLAVELAVGVGLPAPPRVAPYAKPQVYRRGELLTMTRVLNDRWPTLCSSEARRWVERWQDGRSRYARIRPHAVRCQLDAMIALALRGGLRRDEIFRLDLETIDPDNEYIVVWDQAGSWQGGSRRVPYTASMVSMIGPWVKLHRRLAPGQTSAWLNLWSAETVGDPMTHPTFARLLRTYVGEGWSFRRLRATCIVTWIRSGLSLEGVRDMLGLTEIDALLPYARCARAETVREVNRRDGQFAAL